VNHAAVPQDPLRHVWLFGTHLIGALDTRSSSRQPHHQRDEENNQKDIKQYLRNPCRSASNAGKAEYSSYKRNH